MKRPQPSEPLALRNASVLIVGGDAGYRSRLRAALGRHVAFVDSADGAARAGQLMARCRFGFLVVNAGLSDAPALEWIGGLRQDGAAPRVVLVTERPDRELLLEAMRRGVNDVLERPFEIEAALAALQRVAAIQPAGDRVPMLARVPAASCSVGNSSVTAPRWPTCAAWCGV